MIKMFISNLISDIITTLFWSTPVIPLFLVYRYSIPKSSTIKSITYSITISFVFFLFIHYIPTFVLNNVYIYPFLSHLSSFPAYALAGVIVIGIILFPFTYIVVNDIKFMLKIDFLTMLVLCLAVVIWLLIP